MRKPGSPVSGSLADEWLVLQKTHARGVEDYDSGARHSQGEAPIHFPCRRLQKVRRIFPSAD